MGEMETWTMNRLDRLHWILLAVIGLLLLMDAYLIIPPRVRFTGVLLPNKDPSRKGLLDDLEVFIGNEKSTFVLDKMKIVGSVGLNRATLQRLFPPVIRFVGPDELMRRLKSPKIMGKVITIEGLLYTGSRMLFLTEVDDGEEAGTN